MTTTYYLLLKRHIASGGKSIADIASPNFDSNNSFAHNKRQPKVHSHSISPNEILKSNHTVSEYDER